MNEHEIFGHKKCFGKSVENEEFRVRDWRLLVMGREWLEIIWYIYILIYF